MIFQKDKPFFSKLQFEDGFVIVWAGFSANGTSLIESIQSRLNPELLVGMLVENLLPENSLSQVVTICFNGALEMPLSCACLSSFEAHSVT